MLQILIAHLLLCVKRYRSIMKTSERMKIKAGRLRVEAAKIDMEVKIQEKQDEIDKLKESIKIQDKELARIDEQLQE